MSNGAAILVRRSTAQAGTSVAPWSATRKRMSRAHAATAAGIALTLLLLTSATRAQQGQLDASAIRAAIDRALASSPSGARALQSPAQTGVRTLGVEVDRTAAGSDRITIDLSQRALTYDPSGDAEVLVDHILAATAALTAGTSHVSYRFLVDGLPLEQFATRGYPAPRFRTSSADGVTRVVVSPGHGVYFDEWAGGWYLQRNYYWGIVEDLVNWDIAQYVQDGLRLSPVVVQPVRHPDRAAIPGVSGYPGWQESATYFIRGLGVPPEIWNYGVSNYNRDINARPFYANWVDADLMISIHNNGGGGTGTETWYDETNGQEAASRRLAELVNAKVVAAIRAAYDPAWPDRGLRSCNGCKGENRLAHRPAVILEVAFMDTQTPDNAALQDDRFKQIVAGAIRDAIVEWTATQG